MTLQCSPALVVSPSVALYQVCGTGCSAFVLVLRFMLLKADLLFAHTQLRCPETSRNIVLAHCCDPTCRLLFDV